MSEPPLKRVIAVVLDGVGIGALPDAPHYGDGGANTLAHLARAAGGLRLPALERLGLGAITPIEGLSDRAEEGAYGIMAEASAGKDSTVGHWELAGVHVDEPFATFPEGFPKDVVIPFEELIGSRVLGNRPASGTDIIEELGGEHLRTGAPILYTSADSVFQLAAHDGVIEAARLYEFCRAARGLLDDLGLPVLRVIARPFTGRPGAFRRYGRKDFSLEPPSDTILDRLREKKVPVLGIGKVGELFCGRGFDTVRKTANNEEGMSALARFLRRRRRGMILANLSDFDTVYGHRNDVHGFRRALEAFDRFLGSELLSNLMPRDLLLVTSDHGCDPTTESTDHSREYVPLIVAARRLREPLPLGRRESFADVAATVSEALIGEPWPRGKSFWPELSGLW